MKISIIIFSCIVIFNGINCEGLQNGKRITRQIKRYYNKFDVIEETRWHKTFKESEKVQAIVSKFMLGEASIIIEELKAEWDNWSQDEKLDFSMNIYAAPEDQLTEVYIFLARNGSLSVKSVIALPMINYLPRGKCEKLLIKWCKEAPLGDGVNFFQALASMDSEAAEEIITMRLNKLMAANEYDQLLEYYAPTDIAKEAVCCVEYLIKLGVNTDSIATQINSLKRHPAPSVKLDIRRILKEEEGK